MALRKDGWGVMCVESPTTTSRPTQRTRGSVAPTTSACPPL